MPILKTAGSTGTGGRSSGLGGASGSGGGGEDGSKTPTATKLVGGKIVRIKGGDDGGDDDPGEEDEEESSGDEADEEDEEEEEERRRPATRRRKRAEAAEARTERMLSALETLASGVSAATVRDPLREVLEGGHGIPGLGASGMGGEILENL